MRIIEYDDNKNQYLDKNSKEFRDFLKLLKSLSILICKENLSLLIIFLRTFKKNQTVYQKYYMKNHFLIELVNQKKLFCDTLLDN